MRNPPHKIGCRDFIGCIVHDIKPSISRTSDTTGSLTPSGSRSAPVAVAAPAPIPPRDDPDFVWDVFYHRAGLTNEYDAAANVATLYVDPISSFRLLAVNSGLAGRVYPTH